MKFIKISVLATLVVLPLAAASYLMMILPDKSRATLFSLYDKCATCDIAHELAQKDFENKIYRLIIGGFRNTDRAEILDTLLRQNYGIEVLYAGCEGTEEAFCYSNEMARLLGEKFGDDFYDRVSDVANERVAMRKSARHKYMPLAIPAPQKK